MVHKNTSIVITVRENRIETQNYRSLIFERPQGFTFESGDWIDIEGINGPLAGGKTYSLSSSPTDPELMITFKDGFSELKRAMMTAIPGDTFKIVQYGNDYKFTLHPHKPSTLIAGGVGIAPFRSMLKEIIDTGDANIINLLYLNKTPDFLFLQEIEHWSKKLKNFKVSYLVTGAAKKKDKTKFILSAIGTLDQNFYIAGPEGMVESTKHLLIDAGVSVKNIKIDSFGGY